MTENSEWRQLLWLTLVVDNLGLRRWTIGLSILVSYSVYVDNFLFTCALILIFIYHGADVVVHLLLSKVHHELVKAEISAKRKVALPSLEHTQLPLPFPFHLCMLLDNHDNGQCFDQQYHRDRPINNSALRYLCYFLCSIFCTLAWSKICKSGFGLGLSSSLDPSVLTNKQTDRLENWAAVGSVWWSANCPLISMIEGSNPVSIIAKRNQ